MTIPVYRQNLEYDDWEVASVYDSDDCDSFGRSAPSESSQRSGSFGDAAFQLQGPVYADVHSRADYVVPLAQSQLQHQEYPPVMVARSRWDTCPAPGKRSHFAPPPAPIVPPPGVIFPPKDWVQAPQEMYRAGVAGHVVPTSSMAEDLAAMKPPPSSLLLSPCTPPPLIRRPSPTKTIGHGQAPQATTSTGLGVNANTHASPIMPPPPRYHELVQTVSPRLAEGGCQVHTGMVMSPRRSGPHDVLGPETSMARGSQTVNEGAEERFGHGRYRPDRPELGSSKYGHEYSDGGRTRGTARPPTRERKPSIWQRFVRQFSPSRGHT